MDQDTETFRPTPERMKKAGDESEDFITTDHKLGLRLLDGSVLDMLLTRRSITGDEYAAGARFYSDWYKSGLANAAVVDPEKPYVDGGGPSGVTDAALDALERWKKAVRAVGMVHSLVLTDVLLMDMKLAKYGQMRFGIRIDKSEKRATWAAIISLRNALRALDYYYYGRRDTPTRSHMDPGGRPVISPPYDEPDDDTL